MLPRIPFYDTFTDFEVFVLEGIASDVDMVESDCFFSLVGRICCNLRRVKMYSLSSFCVTYKSPQRARKI